MYGRSHSMNLSTDKWRRCSLRVTGANPPILPARAVGAETELLGEKRQDSQRRRLLLTGLRRLEDHPLDGEQALVCFAEGDSTPRSRILIELPA